MSEPALEPTIIGWGVPSLSGDYVLSFESKEAAKSYADHHRQKVLYFVSPADYARCVVRGGRQ